MELVELFPPAHKAEQVATCTKFHDEAQVRIRLERVIEFHNILMMSQVLKDLHVLCNLLLTFDLLVEILLSETFDGYKVTTELVLRDADLSEGTLPQFIANAVKLMSRCNR
mgnify:CR=1 FL=1